MSQKFTRRPLFILLVAISAALLIGFLGLLLPETALSAALTYAINPLQELFLRFLACIAGPMIFLCVALGISGIGDVATLGKIGKRMVFAFFGISFLLSVATALVCLYCYRMPLQPDAETGSQWEAITNMFLNFIPRNIVSPFADGNTLQLIVLGVIIGLAMLFLGKKVEGVANFMEQLNLIIQKIMSGLNKVMHVYVFLALVKMIWSRALAGFKDIWTLPVIFVSVTVAATLVLFILAGLKAKVSPFRLMRICLPQFLIALSTASSTAALDTIFKVSEKKLGIHPTVTKFGVPLSMVMYKTSSVIYLTAVAFYFANAYEVDISLIWVIQAVIMSVALTFAIPPIPGGGLNNYTVLFLQLGVPSSALALALAADSMMEFIITGFNVFTQSPELLSLAKSVDMVDDEILHNR